MLFLDNFMFRKLTAENKFSEFMTVFVMISKTRIGGGS